ncbi:peptidase domain-containing ABC transporter [Aquimarina sp. 2201CG1-2-11]|uniref:peptidase domain-containing ABC transporter n=1 Tax=Aquimarina discodermiae TaxID=3231043 RepID=UPI003462BE2C
MKFIPQKDQMDCGPACLVMVASIYGKKYPLDYIRDLSYITREGVSLLGIKEAATRIGFDAFAAKLTSQDLIEKRYKSLIIHWNQNHFVVLCGVKKNLFKGEYMFKIADPTHGVISLTQEEFEKGWLPDEQEGIVLFLEPTEEFYKLAPQKQNKTSIKYLLNYLTAYKKQLVQMFALLLVGSGITLIFPFLTQHLIDKGVNAKDLNIIGLVLVAQLVLFLGSITIEIVRNWLVLYVGTKMSISIISDFLKKILQLPIKFFDTKMMGDFQQRIQDNERIEKFLTSESLITFFSMITFLVFFGVLLYYDYKILLVYITLTAVAILWSLFWLKKRKYLDYFRFQQRSDNQDSIYEILNGVTEMKLNQFESFKRKKWEEIQKKLFKVNIRILKLDQLQLSGFQFLNQVKNIIVTFMAANYVVHGQMTIGELLSVSYIIGEMNSPIYQLVNFFRSLQDAKLSIERLNEVQNHPKEEVTDLLKISDIDNILINNAKKDIVLSNVDFQYEGPKSPFVLQNINFSILNGKTTAIVGASGSGKTTLMKLLLKFYEPIRGDIQIHNTNLSDVSANSWRGNCGVVMQDGYIFSETLERNIAMGDEEIDSEKLAHAIRVANIGDFVESLPLKLKTKIGAAGNGISGGQKQRILIARAVYKNPSYIFFDEATSALDAENEKIIHDNLQSFFKGKTVLIIAHRLSTVKNADQIIVLRNGRIVEQGNHQQLVENQSDYFSLVKNQLELGV